MSSTKIFFIGGKGGVGKSSISSALACLFARHYKTLLISTDPAHNLSDIFHIQPQHDIQQIYDNLFLLEINPSIEARDYTRQVAEDTKKFVSAHSYHLLENYFANVAQSHAAQESALFDRLIKIITKEEWEHIVIDTAPTGHTLRLFKLPLTLQEWSKTLLNQQEKSRNLENIIGHLPGNSLKERLEERHVLYTKFNNMLHTQQTGIILVLNPDTLSIEETTRAIDELKHNALNPYALAINKIPPPSEDSFFAKRYELAQSHLKNIRQRFSRHMLWEIPLLSGDICGRNALEQIMQVLEDALAHHH